jgi:DNA recombination protein RmuC
MTDMIMGYILLGFSSTLIIILILIYKKLNKKNENTNLKDDFDLERERKKDFNELKDAILNTINTNNTSLKQDFVVIKERVSTVQSTQIELGKLTNEIIDFKNLFNNKTERGRLGEEYLEDIVSDTMSKQHYEFQHTFKNGKRVDCLLTLGSADQSIPIDSKFSWENYKKMIETKDETLQKQHAKDFAQDITNHIEEVSGYVIDGETAPVAYMFVTSEGVFDAIVNSQKDFVKKARAKAVIIVSPDTLFSHLRNYKLIMQNREISRLAKFLQEEVGILGEDVKRLTDRFSGIGIKQEKVTEEFRQLNISVNKVINRSEKIKNLDFEDLEKIEKK